MSTRSNWLWTPVTGLAVAVAGVTGWNIARDTPGAKTTQDDYAFFDELVEVRHLIDQLYVDEPDVKAMREGAIKGMVEALNDPYTVYVPASEQRDFNKDLTGEYVGIGASVNMSSGWLTIVSPLEDTPSFRAGLMPEDRVIEIDGVSTQGKNVEDCVDMLLGKEGTPVKLLIERKGQRFEQTIIREKIKTRSVKGYHRDPADPQTWQYLIDPQRRIAYVRVSQFTPKVAEEVAAALRSVGADRGQLGGLVLDLRFNPGGLLEEANAIADMFLREGVIVSTKGRAHEERVVRARPEGTLADFPLAVIVNQESASASEVLAGALVENGRAIVVGQRSFGKGSVQALRMLSEGTGSELKITEQAYYLPKGRNITRKDDSAQWGVDPSDGFYVPMSDRDVLAMLDVRREQELLVVRAESNADAPRADAPVVPGQVANWSNTAWVLETLKDAQLSAAVRAVQQRIDAGTWQPTGQPGPTRENIAVDQLAKARQYRERIVRELIRAEKRIETLEVAAKDMPESNPKDLWDDGKDLAGGAMEVRDKDGNVVARLRITGNNVERWLMDADVEKQAPDAPPASDVDPATRPRTMRLPDAREGLDLVVHYC